MKGWSAPEAGHAYERARTLAQELGETSQLGSILWGLYVFYVVRGRLHTALELGEQCLQLARDQGDSSLLVVGHFTVGVPSFSLGELRAALRHLEQGGDAYRPETHPVHVFRYGLDYGVFSASYESHFLWYLGYPDQALARSQSTLVLAQNLDHPYTLTVAHSYAAMLHQYRREWRATQAQADAVLALQTQYEFSYYGAWAILMRGWAMAEQGEIRDGIIQMQQGLADLRSMEAGLRETYYLGLLAEVHARAGQAETGLCLLDDALALVQERDEHYHEAELYRLRGELLNLQGDADRRVEECFHRAIEIARQQQAKSLELRAVLSLARLWQRQGKAEEATWQLAAIYNWFTEGADTLDLQEAKALLDDLVQK